MRRQCVSYRLQFSLTARVGFQARPLRVEPRREENSLVGSFRGLNETQGVSPVPSPSPSVLEGKRTQESLLRPRIMVADDRDGLGDYAAGPAHIDGRALKPVSAERNEPTPPVPIPSRAIGLGAKKSVDQCHLAARRADLRAGEQVRPETLETREERKRRRDQVQLGARLLEQECRRQSIRASLFRCCESDSHALR